MALSQRQLREVAEEALQAQQAWDELTSSLRDLLTGQGDADGRVMLLRFILAELPQVSTVKSQLALAHIARTEKRNAKRAAAARQRRGKESRND